MPGERSYWGTTKPPPGTIIDPGHDLTQKLVAYWPLHDGAGYPDDIWGNYPLTPAGAPTPDIGAHGGAAIKLHGSPDVYSSSTITDAFAGQPRITISAWGYRAATTDSFIVGWSPTTHFRCYFIWYLDGNVYWTVDGGPGADSNPNCTLAGIGWHHFVMSYDGARSGVARIAAYIDGVPRTLTPSTSPPGATLNTAANLGNFLIGKDVSNTIWATGRVEDVAVWAARSLTATDARDLYQQPYAMFAPPVWRRSFIPVSAQLAAPTSDISAGGWTPSTGASLFGVLDETVRDDADYVISSRNPSSDTFEVKFAAVTDPNVSTGYKLRYTLGKASSSMGRIDSTVSLVQGTTIIVTYTHTDIPATTTLYTQTLTGGQADSITDHSDLRYRRTDTVV